jgi:hypothetical protein
MKSLQNQRSGICSGPKGLWLLIGILKLGKNNKLLSFLPNICFFSSKYMWFNIGKI